MDRDEVRSIIETTLQSGSSSPGLFDLPKIIGLKSRLEACNSVTEVIDLLEQHRGLVCKAFGVNDALFAASMEKLRRLV